MNGREPYVQDPDFTLFCGDAGEVLSSLVAQSVDCAVTSPPYWGLRDYGAEGQLGLEATPEEYVAALVGVFAEVRRVLTPTGTLWLNLGDTYSRNPAKGGSGPNGKHDFIPDYGKAREIVRGKRVERGEGRWGGGNAAVAGLKEKDLVGIPWRVAFALQEDGWYLRSDIIWAKPNPMPESVTDRPTKAHEYVFLLSKSPRYFYDAAAIAEPATWFGPNGKPKAGPHAGQMQARAAAKRPQQRRAAELAAQHGLTEAHFDAIRSVGIADVGKALTTTNGAGHNDPEKQRLADEAKAALGGYYREFLIPLTRNARSVWEIQTMQYADAHFAVFPEELARRCILAGCPEWVCADCGTALERYTPSHDYQHGAVPSVRGADDGEGPMASDAPVLLPDMREQGDLKAEADREGLRHQPEGLQALADAGSPDGEPRGLRDGASLRDGGAPGPVAEADRGRSSQERRQTGQQGGEPGSNGEGRARSATEAEATADSVPALRRPTDAAPPCPKCGSVLRRQGVVLDPFSGSGTTALVARRLNRKSVGIELNESYCRMAAKRLGQQSLLAEGAA